MKFAIIAAVVLAGAMLAATSAEAQASGNGLRRCTAQVVYSEELPFAPIDSWLIKVTLQIVPRNGVPYYLTLQERMPSQGRPPRRGQAFHLWCDPAHPNDLRFASRNTFSF